MQRVAIIGCGGSGKSTLTRRLSRITALPARHLDTIFWKSGWIEEDPEVFRRKQRGWVEQQYWIIDGNMHNTLELRLARADTIIFLDYPTWRCVYGVLKRLKTDFGKVRDDMARGCPERFDWAFIKYVLNFRRKTRPRILKKIDEHGSGSTVLRFRSPLALDQWLHTQA